MFRANEGGACKRLQVLLAFTLSLPISAPTLASAAQKYAVLIGVSPYTVAQVGDKNHILYGPRNDVLLMWKTLKEEGIAPQNMTLLANLDTTSQLASTLSPIVAPVVGEVEDSARSPTRKNILDALDDVVKKIRPGDQVLIYYSGHGSVFEEKPDPKTGYREVDKHVNILLPIDIGHWDGKAEVTGQIADYEIDAKMQAIEDKGGFVWLVEDACHSGSVDRALAFDKVGLISKEVPAAVLGAPPELPVAANAKSPLFNVPRAAAGGHFVGFYGATASTTAVQTDMPRNDTGASLDNARPFGLLTYYLVQAIRQHRAATYKDLALQIDALFGDFEQFPVADQSSPTPAFAGDLRQFAPMVGGPRGPANDAPNYQVEFVSKDYTPTLWLDAGLFDGITKSAIVALLRADRDDATPIGYTKVTQAGADRSRLEPIQYVTNQPLVDESTLRKETANCSNRCVIGTPIEKPIAFVLRAAVDDANADPAAKEWLDDAVKNYDPDKSTAYQEAVQFVALSDHPDIVLKLKGKSLWFLPPGEQIPAAGNKSVRMIPFTIDPRFTEEDLSRALQAVAHAKSVLHIASLVASSSANIASKIDVQFFRKAIAANSDPKRPCDIGPYPRNVIGASPIEAKGGKPMTADNCEEILVRLHNRNAFPVKVTPLGVSADYGVGYSGPDQGLLILEPTGPASTKVVRFVFVTRGRKVWAGAENAIVIYEQTDETEVDQGNWGWLSSPGLSMAESTQHRGLKAAIAAASVPPTGLRKVLADALYQGHKSVTRSLGGTAAVGAAIWQIHSIPQ